ESQTPPEKPPMLPHHRSSDPPSIPAWLHPKGQTFRRFLIFPNFLPDKFRLQVGILHITLTPPEFIQFTIPDRPQGMISRPIYCTERHPLHSQLGCVGFTAF